jgi:hypothetical protein
MYQHNYFYFCHLFLYGMRHTDTAIPSSNGRQFGKMLTSFRPHDQMIWSSGNHWLPTNLHINSLHSVNNLKQNYDSKQKKRNYLFLFCGIFRTHCNKYHYEKNSIPLGVSESPAAILETHNIAICCYAIKNVLAIQIIQMKCEYVITELKFSCFELLFQIIFRKNFYYKWLLLVP